MTSAHYSDRALYRLLRSPPRAAGAQGWDRVRLPGALEETLQSHWESSPAHERLLGPQGWEEFAKNNSMPALNCSQLHSLDAKLLIHDSYQLSEREL